MRFLHGHCPLVAFELAGSGDVRRLESSLRAPECTDHVERDGVAFLQRSPGAWHFSSEQELVASN